MRMLDDFIMNFSWEDEEWSLEDWESDYLTKEQN